MVYFRDWIDKKIKAHNYFLFPLATSLHFIFGFYKPALTSLNLWKAIDFNKVYTWSIKNYMSTHGRVHTYKSEHFPNDNIMQEKKKYNITTRILTSIHSRHKIFWSSLGSLMLPFYSQRYLFNFPTSSKYTSLTQSFTLSMKK